MKRNNLLNSVSEKLSLHNKRSQYKQFVRMFALLVVFATVAGLTLPAQTLEARNEKTLICTVEDHAHVDECFTDTLNCRVDEIPDHVHTDECLGETKTLVCELAVQDSHAHTDECYTLSEPVLVCELTETEGHTHTDQCMAEKQVLICTTAETAGHAHTEECMVARQQLGCELAETEGHTHTEECNVETSVLSCGMSEGDGAHVHAEGTCWTMTKSENLICTPAEGEEHTHTDECYELVRTDICTLEETAGHVHTDACYTMQTEIGCGLEECEPHVHTEACYVEVFTAGCGLEECEPHTHTETCFTTELAPRCGMEECEPHAHTEACYKQEKILACELVEQTESHTEHTDECYVTEQTYICGLEGYVVETPEPTPENPQRVEEVIALIDTLPRIGEVEEAVKVLEEEKDYVRRKAVLMQVVPQIQAAFDKYNALTEADRAFVTNAETLLNAGWLLTVEIVHFHPALEIDDAYVANIAFTDITVIHPVTETEQAEETAETLQTEIETQPAEEQTEAEENVIVPGDRITYAFTVDTAAYIDMCYGQGRIRVEFVLPVDETQAAFDMASVSWLDTTEGYAPVLTAETRTIDGEEKACQVLTGYILLNADGENCAVPGTFSADITVQVGEIPHGEQLVLTMAAAMEHNVWSGVCDYHQAEEKRTLTSDSLTAANPLSEEEQLANFQAFLEEIKALDLTAEDIAEQTEDLRLRILKALNKGEISKEQYDELIEAIEGDNDEEHIVGEMAFGENYLLFAEEFWASRGGYATPVRKMATYNMLRSSTRAMLANVETEYVGENNEPSDKQIFKWGGTTETSDGVNVSKIIDGTALENVFDITLTVTANESIKEIIEEPDMAVAVVMDISQTMNNNFGDTTRYEAAVVAANQFLENFAKSNTLGVSKVGFVAFNTDAHEIFPLSSCTTANVGSLKAEMKDETDGIIYDYHHYYNSKGNKVVDDHDRFTNIEAGLKRGWDMIKDAPNKNKYIIFLSDGFPTTYISSGYNGYCTYDDSGTHVYTGSATGYGSEYCTHGNDGIQFTDKVINKNCIYGTSYSDTAAIKAREMATSIKADGINVFSIGVDIGGQTITNYLPESGDDYSVVERTSTTYELGSPNSADSFKNWLKNKIGSGYYYDSTNSAELEAAYDEIFAEIKRINAESAKADWVANDPMPYSGAMTFVEFIGLYDKDDVLRTIDTKLQHNTGDTENTAAYDTATRAINWDLKTSYADTTSSVINGETKTVYKYELKYRVRLKNEIPTIAEEGMFGFAEEGYYNTNNPTTLKYKVTETKDGVLQVSDVKTVNFPIPYVQGYLSELNFNKVDIYDKPVVGAEFTLTHNDVLCAHCRGDIYGKTDAATGTVGTIVTREAVGSLAAGPLVYTAVSEADGKVSFANIPSGHQYILTETQAPAGYAPLDRQYLVTVAYDNQSITVTDLDGKTITEDGKLVVWDGKVVNITSVELPSTGGIGTFMYTAVGAALALTAAAGALINKKRKENED